MKVNVVLTRKRQETFAQVQIFFSSMSQTESVTRKFAHSLEIHRYFFFE
jgi:hypothetical protein